MTIAADVKRKLLRAALELMQLSASETDLVTFVNDFTGGRGVDIIFEGVGMEYTFVPSLKTLKKGGTLLLSGYDPIKSIPLDALGMHYNEWTVIGTRLGTKDELLRLIELTGRGMLEPVIARKFRFRDVNEALEELKKGHIIGRIVLTDWS